MIQFNSEIKLLNWIAFWKEMHQFYVWPWVAKSYCALIQPKSVVNYLMALWNIYKKLYLPLTFTTLQLEFYKMNLKSKIYSNSGHPNQVRPFITVLKSRNLFNNSLLIRKQWQVIKNHLFSQIAMKNNDSPQQNSL